MNLLHKKGEGLTPVALRSFVLWQDRAQSFEALAIAQVVPVNIQGSIWATLPL